jgi:hypothetical protein
LEAIDSIDVYSSKTTKQLTTYNRLIAEEKPQSNINRRGRVASKVICDGRFFGKGHGSRKSFPMKKVGELIPACLQQLLYE